MGKIRVVWLVSKTFIWLVSLLKMEGNAGDSGDGGKAGRLR